MTDSTSFPYPIPEYGAEPYWAACNEGRLIMQRCNACAKFRWQPSPWCTYCASDVFTWIPLSGHGRVITWTEITHPVHPAALALVPYIVAEIGLVEQADLRMLSNIVDAIAADIAIDAPVELAFVTHPSGQRLPVFRLLIA